ncbi:protein mini spindles [Anabrus simplex]|uniref:protein mini spindles n=1 Tax=Anabrus simplex TaxID=316456 RepID=UPI0035A2B156
MEEDTDYTKLPIEEQCVHKLWKARVLGYEGAAKLFRQIDDEKSPEFGKFLGLVKKFVVDSNAAAQEKGLEAVLAFVENYAHAGKTVGEVMSGIVSKCIAAPKAKTKEMAVQITLMYIEIEKYEAVEDELLKGMDHKNPKTVAACVAAMTLALREFGSKVINIKPLLKKISPLLEDRDKTVRDETKALVIEMYRWVGVALKPQLSSLKPVQVTELEAEFEKVKGDRVAPTRYLKSQQQKQAKLNEAAAAGDDDGGGDEIDVAEEVDPYDLMDPVDILSKIPKDFQEKLEDKKWQERKSALETLEELLQAPKLENGDYGDVVRALKKVVSKDSNILVVTLAAKCLASLANGLKKRFQPYALACIPCILEKFREKKQTVVTALKDAIDAIYISATIENIQEDVLASLENKNPSVKAETASFLARCFTKCTPAMLTKKILKAYSSALLKLLNDPDPNVREQAAEALGTAMKVVGEKAISPFLGNLEQIKLTKIKECCDKAVIVAKVPKERPKTAPAAVPSGDNDGPKAGSAAPKPVKRPVSSAAKKVVKKLAPSGSADTKSKGPSKQVEKELSADDVDEKATDLFGEEVISGLCDANWKIRLSAMEQIVQKLNEMEPGDIPAQVVIRLLNKKPGLKDTNFQVLKARLEALKMVVETAEVSSVSADACVVDVADKLGDPKNGALAAETLSALADAASLNLVATQVLDFAFNQKNPKVQLEALNWLAGALMEFGFAVQPKGVIENVKKAISATHPGVRSAGIQFTGTLYLYMGQKLSVFFENEKPAIKQQIQAEFDKHVGESPPAPTRGHTKGTEDEDDDDQSPDEKININELMPHVDISHLITDSLLSLLTDKNWKVRNEAFQKLDNILKENKFVSSNLGDLPQVLPSRLLDSNSNIAKIAIAFCQSLGAAMGAQCKVHVTTVFPPLLQCLGDNKAWIRTGAIACINTWGEQCGFKEFFKCEMIADALKSDSPSLRTELWAWLAEKLPDLPSKSIPKEELLVCLPYLYSNLEDRNADVRKNAQEAILPFMIHLNYQPMLKATDKLKTSSKMMVVTALEKVRPSVPVKQTASKKGVANIYEDEPAKPVKGTGTKGAPGGKVAVKGKTAAGAAGKPGSRKKEEEVDTAPLLQSNNLKNQRNIDEQKLRVLKWNFTTPREEFVDLLRDQMATANVNKSLMANMFHSDFKYHLKAIEQLNEDLPLNGSATVANLDLILKWMTLRFFDTNPSVLLKGLEYLQTVFTMLIDEDYNMYESEATSFVPYLILKIGDPKDAVRNSVKALFKQMETIYPVGKLFGHVMEGLKSKNARQRTECLDLLGSLIENYGVTVCSPSPAAALKDIAKQISDRDNSVRNAALNCVVQAFFLEGERVYKMIGQISDKDQSLLEERIKRAAKNRPPPGTRPPAAIAAKQMQVPQPSNMVRQGSEDTLHRRSTEPEEPVGSPILRNSVPKPRPVSGPFGLDTKLLERIEGDGIDLCAPKLKEFDLKEILEPPVDIPAASFNTSGGCLNETIHNFSSSTVMPHTKQFNSCTTTEEVLDLGISNIASPDFDVAWQACMQVEALLSSDKVNRMQGKEDSLLTASVMQLRLLRNSSNHGKPVHTLEIGYRSLLRLIMEVFEHRNLALNVSKSVLVDLIEELLMLLVEQRLDDLDSGNSYVRIINIMMVRIIERSNPTCVICAFLQHLHNCSANNNCLPLRFEELTLKCLWKVIRLIPTWESDLDVAAVLRELHIFLRDYPSSVWKRRSSDTPCRTVKTILHTLVKIVGSEKILQFLHQIDNLNESELQPYLIKLSKRMKSEDTIKSLPKREGKGHHRLSKVTHEQLSEIFKKIGSKDQTKEGLELLYDFREQHPEADIEPFLRKSSQFFQDYIERGLQTIQAQRKSAEERGGIPNAKPMSTTTSMSSLGLQESGGSLTPFSESGDTNLIPSAVYSEHTQTVKTRMNMASGEDLDSNTDSKNAMYYLERLRALQARAGLQEGAVQVESVVQQHQQQPPPQQQQRHYLHHLVTRDDNLTNNENLILSRHREQHDEPKTEPHSSSSTGFMGIDDLRKRLEAFKTTKR